jgi:clan AA aspartic protease (TIGR02281 family)
MGWTRRYEALGAAVAIAGLLALAGCGGRNAPVTDEFMTDTQVDGPLDVFNPLTDDKYTWQLESMVAKAPPHAVVHRLLVAVYPRVFFTPVAIQAIRYDRAADETGTPLQIVPITSERCPQGNPSCMKKISFDVAIADEALRRHVLTGYRVRVEARTREAGILSLSPKEIQEQLSAVDRLVAGTADAAPPAAADGPRLGIGVIAASATPFDDLPQGVIVVATADRSPAAAAGILPGDVLLAVDGEPVRVSADVGRLVSGAGTGGVTLALKRGDSPYSVKLNDRLEAVEAAAIGPPAAAQTDIVAHSVDGSTNAERKIVALAHEGGTYVVPVTINGAITLNFVVDSGASDVSIPADVASTLMRAGTIAKGDFLGSESYVLADGSKMPSQKFRVRSLRVGDLELRDVTASIAPARGELLLGQSFLGRLKSWSIDNASHALIIN